MGLKEKLMFWKKEDLDFSDMPSDISNSNNMGLPLSENIGLPSDKPMADPFGGETTATSLSAANYSDTQKPSSFSAKRDNQLATFNQRDLELISSKLDTIKAVLQSLDQRVGVIEQIAKSEQVAQQNNNNSNNNNNKNSTNHLW